MPAGNHSSSLISAWVRHHHEKWDGTGYSDRLRGEAIPLLARIVAICDAFDAMTSDRPYRTAMDHETAVAILSRGAGSQWDPGLVPTFLGLLARPDAAEEAA
jgi:HD-GYP domain-containing protein (c-di-GMP phosphodiesterase class II)